MARNIFIAPSLLACDFSKIGEQLSLLEQNGVKYIHLDVMDGIFVPNISFGQPLIKSLRKTCRMVFDTHLMIKEPERYIKEFAQCGADIITIHYEAACNPERTLIEIRKLGLKSGLSIKPATSPQEIFRLLEYCDIVLVMSVEPGFGGQKFMENAVDKIRVLDGEIKSRNLQTVIEVDGGIDSTNASLCVSAGASLLVAGSSVFGHADIVSAHNNIIRSLF